MAKHAGGRPTKYNPKMVKIAQEYINFCGNKELPTIVGLALKLGVDDETIGLWANMTKFIINDEGHTESTNILMYPEFSAAIKDLKAKQQNQLINDGLYGGRDVNPAMAIFLLKNNHGMKDRSDVTTNDKDLPSPLLGGAAKNSIDNV